MAPLSYRRHRSSPEIIWHAIWLYLRFTLSYRNVEEMLAERGLDVAYLFLPEALGIGDRPAVPGPQHRSHQCPAAVGDQPSPDVAAARAFSRTMRWYSAGEHLFCATSSARRAIVSHDAIIRSVIKIGRAHV